MPNSDLVQSLLRGLDLLKHISSRTDGMRLNELTAVSGLKKPTVHNLLRTLAARGFVVKDTMNRFNIGPALYEIAGSGSLIRRQMKAQAVFVKLAQQLPESVITLSNLAVDSVRCLLRMSPDAPGELQRPVERFFTPYVTVSSIVLQSEYPLEAQRLEQHYPFDEYGIGMWGNLKKFEAAKARVVQEKYCCRISKGMVSIAFAMPECYALGFHFPIEDDFDVEKYRRIAAEFRNLVWEKDDNTL